MLVFIGVKMLLSGIYHIPIGVSLGVVAGVLGLSVVGSLAFPQVLEENPEVTHDPLDQADDPARPILPDDRNENMIADDEETLGTGRR